ncbi:MAG: hypothetical protein HKO65_01300 [Gemmatimonadetes bacterium]|nr:hypothetical protein [Gemmatimonadota bacterium]NNM03709.1 hypothetical protein [Gemmatimonadota bacterium]
MKVGTRKDHRLKAILASVAIIGSGACTEYRIETALNSDGSGHRSVTLEATDPNRLGEDVTRRDFVEFMSVTEGNGWDHTVQVKSNGDTLFVFKRETPIRDLNAWTDLNDEIHIFGALPKNADTKLGHLRLGDLQLRNRVRVSAPGRTDGTATFIFQETFEWDHGLEAVLEVFVSEIERFAVAVYPRLSSQERGEILGIARATLWPAFENGMLDQLFEEDEELWNQALDQISRLAAKTIRTKYPDAGPESVRERFDLFSEEFEGEVFEPFDRLLPGFSLAGTSVSFRLTMPGRITNTNAHERENNTLIWEFNTDDAITAPVVLLAESVVGGSGIN